MKFLISGENTRGIVSGYLLGERADQLGFLPMLFWVFVLSCLLCDWVDVSRCSRRKVLLLIGGGYALYLVSILLNAAGVPGYYRWISAMTYELYFILGMLFEKAFSNHSETIMKNHNGLAYLLVFGGVSISGTWIIEKGILGAVKYFVLPAIHIAGVLFWILFIMNTAPYLNKLLPKEGFIWKLWGYFKKNCFYIYLIHQQLVYLVLKVMNRPSVPPVAVVLTSFLFSVFGSILIWEMVTHIYKLFICITAHEQ